MAIINVKRGIQFRPDLFAKSNRAGWYEAAGKVLETKGLTVKVGDGAAAKLVKDGTTFKSVMGELTTQANSANSPLKAYLTDLHQAIDDLVKGDVTSKSGDVFDLSTKSDMAKALGVDDAKRSNYAASTTAFGKAALTKPEATMVIGDVTLQVRGASTNPIDLSGVTHMSAETFKSAPVAYGRDGEEVEDTRVITGLTKAETVKLANDALADLQRPKAAAGLTLGEVPFDEMNWESDAHAMRRANPYVSFTLDSRSFEINPNNGQPRVAIGRDFFFDSFGAKKDLATGKLNKDMQKAGLMYRSRIRYGSDKDPFTGTRVLIGMKEGTEIIDGTKHARKIDSRTDSANQQVFDTLEKSAFSGKVDASWGSQAGAVAPAAEAMFRTAVRKGITDDVGGERNVLVLEAGAMARQIRGRFHLNETSPDAILDGFRNGSPKVGELAALIAAAPDWAAANNLPSKAQLLAQAEALTSRKAIVEAAAPAIKKISPSTVVDQALIDRLWPDQAIASTTDAKLQRAVADAIRSQYDVFAENIDQLQRKIGGNEADSVRQAGSAGDVREFLRGKAAVVRFMATAEQTAGSGVVVGQPATYTAYAKKVVDMPDSKEKTTLLQSMGIGVSQLKDLTDASFTSKVKVDGQLTAKQTFAPFIAEFDKQLTGANKDDFTAELAAYLDKKNSPALKNATDKSAVAADLRKNLVTAHAEILHRQVEAAGAWAQATWFNNYRQTELGINPQSWNFIIGSMDYSEFYDPQVGRALTFAERVSRKPLDESKMAGAMISNDIQIELEAEEGFTAAIREAQYEVNAATAGVFMDYALAKNTPGVTPGDAPAFERWFAAQAALPPLQRDAMLADVATFAKSKGTTIDVKTVFAPLTEQQLAVRTLAGFAKKANPSLNVDDRAALETWYRQQAAQPEEKLNDFLTEMAQYCAEQKADVPLSPNLLRTLDFKPFAGTNVARPYAAHTALVDKLSVANEVWSMMKQAQKDLSTARGAEVQKVLRDNGLRNKGWEPPTKPKGDYAIDYVLP